MTWKETVCRVKALLWLLERLLKSCINCIASYQTIRQSILYVPFSNASLVLYCQMKAENLLSKQMKSKVFMHSNRIFKKWKKSAWM